MVIDSIVNWAQQANIIDILLDNEVITQMVSNEDFTELRICNVGIGFNYYDDFSQMRTSGGYDIMSHGAGREPEITLTNYITDEIGGFVQPGDTLFINFADLILTQP